MGLSFADVRDTVRVASAKCDVSEAEYLPSRRIVCYTRAPSTRQKQGQVKDFILVKSEDYLKKLFQHVIVRLRDDRKYTAVSTQTFTYTNPQISSFQPFRGPKSGGTDLTVI